MTRLEDRALLGGVAALASAVVLLELLSFRLCAATFGGSFATLVGLLAPFAMALGAVTLGRRSATVGAHRLAKSAAYGSLLAGVTMVTGTVAVSWASQALKRLAGEGEQLHVLVVLVGFLLPAWLAGGALATAVRSGLRTIGRLGFAEAAGGVVACLLVPAAMWVGVPRAALIGSVLFGVAAFCFGYVGRTARVRWPVLVTLPLAVLVLVLGDMGAPWLKLRIDTAGRGKVEAFVWTSAGLITVDKPSRNRTRFRVDDTRAISVAHRLIGKRVPGYRVQDSVYDLLGRATGPVLVVGASGGRELQLALAQDHERVDWVAPHQALVQDVLIERYGALTNHLLADERIVVQLGDGRRAMADLPRDYAHVVVLGIGEGAQAAPRLVTEHDRLLTTEAIQAYLLRLRPQGSLVLRSSLAALPALIATVVAAVGEPAEKTRERMFACVDAKGGVSLLVGPKAIDPVSSRALSKNCKKARCFVAYPLPEIRSKTPGRALAERERSDRMDRLEGGDAVHDERPFLLPPPPSSQLAGTAMDALRRLRPQAPGGQAKSPGRKTEPKPPPAHTLTGQPWEAGGDVERGKRSRSGVTVAAAAIGFLALLVILLVPAARPGVQQRSVPVLLRLAFPLFGLALALGLFILVERLLRLLGDGAYAWSLLIPLGLAAVGGGRLWVDALARPRARRTAMIVLGAGATWLLVLAAAVQPLLRAVGGGMALSLVVVLVVTLVTGWLLGAPLALGLVLVRELAPAQASWCWGAHHVGWALGAAVAAALVHTVGLLPILPIAVAAYAVAAALYVLGSRGVAESRPHPASERAARSAAPPQPAA